MTTHHLFYIAFASQILLISALLPRRILGRLRHLVENYPPEDYPRLYTVPIARVERTHRLYWVLNLAVLAIGVALWADGFRSPARELLNWDNDSVLFGYWMLQMSPLLLSLTPGFTYFNLKRKTDGHTTRKAQLRPRRLFDFVSPAALGLALFVYVAFVSFVVFVTSLDKLDDSWFGGYWNIVGISAVNLLFAFVAAKQLRGRKCDPFQDEEDRHRQIAFSLRLMVVSSILATLFVALSIGLSAFDLRELSSVFQSFYLQLVSTLSVLAFRIDKVNFEVYRQEPIST